MNILVIGSGGREHAVVKALAESPAKPKLFCAPGNAGIAQLAQILNLNIKDHSQVLEASTREKIDLVFIGPEDPLVDGLADTLRQKNISVFGPSKEAAQLEGSKIFAKAFMKKAGVPTAEAFEVSTVEAALSHAKSFTPPYILKADGLAAGKGVFICKTSAELKLAAQFLFETKSLGAAGHSALLEKNLPGYEISFLILTNGEDFAALPLAQDHKRLLDDDKGPNTGGMGTFAPMNIDQVLYDKIIQRVVAPSVQQLKKEKFVFRGVLFIGLMIVDNEPYVLEYNVRFGDPETQVILPLIQNDLADIFLKLSHGEIQPLNFKKQASFCIVNAAPGYPDQPQKNIAIELPSDHAQAYVLHAGTALDSAGNLVSNGGRVLNIVAIADTPESARKSAYEFNTKVKMQGRQFRNDIGLPK